MLAVPVTGAGSNQRQTGVHKEETEERGSNKQSDCLFIMHQGKPMRTGQTLWLCRVFIGPAGIYTVQAAKPLKTVYYAYSPLFFFSTPRPLGLLCFFGFFFPLPTVMLDTATGREKKGEGIDRGMKGCYIKEEAN